MPNIYPNSQPQPYYGVNGKLTDDAKALPVPKKVFILDKSVLLYSPYAVFAFDEHTVTIPFNVIRDLDAIKKSQGESSRNAQEALSIIETLREKGNLRCGVPLENGGMFFVDDSSNETLLESAYSCMRHCPKESEIIVVSNSIATRIRMEESGFKAEVYRSDSVMTDTPYLGRTTAHCYDTEIDASGIPNEIPVSAVETDESLVENEFVTVKRADDSTIGVYQAKGKKLVRLNMDKMYPYGVKPKNLGQKMAIHALMDSLQSSSLTILMGDAGTAKTFLSLACGLEQTLGVEHISKNRRDDIEEPHRYIVTYEYEYNGKTYKKKCKEHEKSQGRAIYIPNGNPKKAFFSEEDHPITLGRLVPIFMLVGIAVLYFTITKTMQMLVIIRTAPIGSETMMKTLEQFL